MIDYLLVKLASRCNYDCSYCYWFKDPTVRTLPSLMQENVMRSFLPALERHILKHELSNFTCSFHGGEPLLFGADTMAVLLQKITEIGLRTDCQMRYAITTNASLLTNAWIQLIVQSNISVAVSIDGPPEVHDKRRKTLKGGPTWRSTVDGYLKLCNAGVAPSIIGVCDPEANPEVILRHFVHDLGAKYCDILAPDGNHETENKSIGHFYVRLFDCWYDSYSKYGVEVRILSEFMRGLLGLQSRSDQIGFAPLQTVCLSPSGMLEPHDVLRIAGHSEVETSCSIFDNELDAILSNPTWLAHRQASLTLCPTCSACRYKHACGGGQLAQRWSSQNRYLNPSIYCSDYKRIFDHISVRIAAGVQTGENGVAVDTDEIVRALQSGNTAAVLF